MEYTAQISRHEAKDLAAYLNTLADQVPRGLSQLSDTLTFASLDLISFGIHCFKMKTFDRAVAFAQSIPRFTDFESDEFTIWLINDAEYLKYWE